MQQKKAMANAAKRAARREMEDDQTRGRIHRGRLLKREQMNCCIQQSRLEPIDRVTRTLSGCRCADLSAQVLLFGIGHFFGGPAFIFLFSVLTSQLLATGFS